MNFDAKRRKTWTAGRLAFIRGLGRSGDGCGREDDNIREQATTLRGRPMARGKSAIGHGWLIPRSNPAEHGDCLSIGSPRKPAIMKETGTHRPPISAHAGCHARVSNDGGPVGDRSNTRVGDESMSYSIDLHRYAELHAFLQLQTYDAHDYESNADQPPDEGGLMEPDDANQGRSRCTNACPYGVSVS